MVRAVSDWHSLFWQSHFGQVSSSNTNVLRRHCPDFPIITQSWPENLKCVDRQLSAAECLSRAWRHHLLRQSVSRISETDGVELYSFYIFCRFSVCVQLMRPCGSVDVADALVLHVPAVALLLFKGAFDYRDCSVSWIAAFQNSCNQHLLTESSTITAIPSLRAMLRNK